MTTLLSSSFFEPTEKQLSWKYEETICLKCQKLILHEEVERCWIDDCMHDDSWWFGDVKNRIQPCLFVTYRDLPPIASKYGYEVWSGDRPFRYGRSWDRPGEWDHFSDLRWPLNHTGVSFMVSKDIPRTMIYAFPTVIGGMYKRDANNHTDVTEVKWSEEHAAQWFLYGIQCLTVKESRRCAVWHHRRDLSPEVPFPWVNGPPWVSGAERCDICGHGLHVDWNDIVIDPEPPKPPPAKVVVGKTPRELATRGEIYLIRAEPLEKFGLVGYIGQTINSERREKEHLNGKFDGTKMLVSSMRVKGCTPVYERIASYPRSQLNDAERDWFTRYKAAGWTLFNRTDLRLYEGEETGQLTPV